MTEGQSRPAPSTASRTCLPQSGMTQRQPPGRLPPRFHPAAWLIRGQARPILGEELSEGMPTHKSPHKQGLAPNFKRG
jgi:hypothetical protein